MSIFTYGIVYIFLNSDFIIFKYTIFNSFCTKYWSVCGDETSIIKVTPPPFDFKLFKGSFYWTFLYILIKTQRSSLSVVKMFILKIIILKNSLKKIYHKCNISCSNYYILSIFTSIYNDKSVVIINMFILSERHTYLTNYWRHIILSTHN